jgi:hypothetical protein
MVAVLVLTTQNRFPFWRPHGRKQFSVLAWQAQKQFSVSAILAGVVVLATETVFLFSISETAFCFGNSILTGNDKNDNDDDEDNKDIDKYYNNDKDNNNNNNANKDNK